MTSSVIFPPGQVTPLGDARIQAAIVPQVSFVGADGTKFYLQGGKSPSLSCEDGFGLLSMEGLQAPFELLDEQGARQDGITNLDTVFGPAIIKMTLEASGVTPASMRAAIRAWISSWNPPNVGTLTTFTRELGHWWIPVRQHKRIPDQMQQDISLHRRFRFDWEARGDNAFWQGPDSLSTFPAPGLTLADGTTGFCPLTNFGTRPAFPRFLCYGPGTFTLGNGANLYATGSSAVSGRGPGIISTATTPVTFGPLEAGQIALITTLPRLRSVVDVSPDQPAQSQSQFQALMSVVLNLVANNNTPPLLEALESVFGILPPNGPMYSLLNGRFTTQSAIPGKQDGYSPATAYIPVGISGGNSASKIIAAITPQRTWPW